MHGLALGYLRHLRAFNFNPSCDLTDLIWQFTNLLLQDPYESLTKLSKLKEAYYDAWQHLDIKAKNDEELKNLDYFSKQIDDLHQKYEDFKKEFDKRVKDYQDQIAIYQQENSGIIKLYDKFFTSSQNQIRDLNRSILLAHETLLLKADERKRKNILEENHLKRIAIDLDKLL